MSDPRVAALQRMTAYNDAERDAIESAVAALSRCKELEDALVEQRRYFSKENDAELAQTKRMRDAMWELLRAAEAVSALDWSENDYDAVATIHRLRDAVEKITR